MNPYPFTHTGLRDAGANRLDRASPVTVRDHAVEVIVDAEPSRPPFHIGRIHAGSVQANEHLSRTGCRGVEFANPDDFRCWPQPFIPSCDHVFFPFLSQACLRAVFSISWMARYVKSRRPY